VKLNTKMRYGSRAMVELDLYYEQGPISLREIAERQGISEKYLESLLGILRSAGLVQAVRGPQGGYLLARPPEQITLRELFEILEGREAYAPCTLDHSACQRWAACPTQEVWAKMYEASMQVLESATLADLAARNLEQRSIAAGTYEI